MRFPVVLSVFTFALTGAAPAAILFSDSFDSVVGTGTTIHGRTPNTSFNGQNWVAPTGNFLSNGSGLLSANSGSANTASLDLGANYLTNNPGVYQISLTINQPDISGNSWIALGFTAQSLTTDNLVGNLGAPWMLFRLAGPVNVYGGQGVTNQRTNTTGMATVTATRSVAHVFTLTLDTSATNWTMDAAIDGTPIDINGTATPGNTYSYTSNPTASRYVAMSTGTSGTSATGTVDNFSVTVTPVPEPSAGALLLGGVGLLLGTRRRILGGLNLNF